MELEKIVESLKNKWLDKTVELAENRVYRYGVDVASGWIYFTPTYAVQEVVAKYIHQGFVNNEDIDAIVKTRVIGLLAHAIAMRPIGLLRKYVADKWGVTKDSSIVDKIKVNLVAFTPIQAPVYAGMLAGGMVWSGNYDIKSSVYAWTIGVGLGALHSFPYGFFQDKVKKFCGIKPAIGEKEKSSN